LTKLESHLTGIGDFPALLVVDMCRAFTDPLSPLGFKCDDLIQANINLVNKFRLNNFPVIFTTTVYHNESEASVFRSKIPALNILEPGSDAVSFNDGLSPLKNEVLIEKKFASAFFQTNLIHFLDKANVNSIVVCGVTTSGCVRATAVDSLQNNLSTTIVEDCVGDRDLDAHKANLHDLRSKYADVIHSHSIFK
jgi:nicotinamidase-related amidase